MMLKRRYDRALGGEIYGYAVTSPEEMRAVAKTHGFPLQVQSTEGTVIAYRVEDKGDLAAAVELAWTGSPQHACVVEKYIAPSKTQEFSDRSAAAAPAWLSHAARAEIWRRVLHEVASLYDHCHQPSPRSGSDVISWLRDLARDCERHADALPFRLGLKRGDIGPSETSSHEVTPADRAAMAQAGGIAERDLPAGAAEASRDIRLRDALVEAQSEIQRLTAELEATKETHRDARWHIKRLTAEVEAAKEAGHVEEREWMQQNGVSRGSVPAPGDKCGHNRCLGTLRPSGTPDYVRCDRCAIHFGPGPGAQEALEAAEHRGRMSALKEAALAEEVEGALGEELDRLLDERDVYVDQITEIHAALGHCDREWSNCHDLGTCAEHAAKDLAAKVAHLMSEVQERKNRASSS